VFSTIRKSKINVINVKCRWINKNISLAIFLLSVIQEVPTSICQLTVLFEVRSVFSFERNVTVINKREIRRLREKRHLLVS
jgi:hypothetical protein